MLGSDYKDCRFFSLSAFIFKIYFQFSLGHKCNSCSYVHICGDKCTTKLQLLLRVFLRMLTKCCLLYLPTRLAASAYTTVHICLCVRSYLPMRPYVFAYTALCIELWFHNHWTIVPTTSFYISSVKSVALAYNHIRVPCNVGLVATAENIAADVNTDDCLGTIG